MTAVTPSTTPKAGAHDMVTTANQGPRDLKLFLKADGEIRAFQNKHKQRQCLTMKITLQKILKETLHTGERTIVQERVKSSEK